MNKRMPGSFKSPAKLINLWHGQTKGKVRKTPAAKIESGIHITTVFIKIKRIMRDHHKHLYQEI